MSKIKIVALGDSTTFGFPYGPLDSWTKLLDDEIFGEVINKGINGNTTTDMLRRFERDVITHKPDFVIITGGINDIVSGESLDRIKWNISEMVEASLEHNIKPIIGLPSALDYVPWENSLEKLRIWLREYAQQLKLDIIDFAVAFFNNDGTIKSNLLLDDGGHPSKAGYKQMFKQIDLNIFTN